MLNSMTQQQNSSQLQLFEEYGAMLPIREAAKIFDVSVETIRRWEKKNLIHAHRDHRGYRTFEAEEISNYLDKLHARKKTKFSVLKAETPSKYKVIELFAGAGGLALGLENSGLITEALVEIDKNSVATLRRNRPNWNVIDRDVTNVHFKEGQADIVAGGFPCQAFSYAGKKLGFEDVRGTLFFEFARVVSEVKPSILLAENVRGLVSHDQGRTLQTMLDVLDELGYNTSYKILHAQYFDVAQKRERLVIIGVRKDLNTEPDFPIDQNYTISLRDALDGVPDSDGFSYSGYKSSIMRRIPEGGYWKDLPLELQEEYLGKSFHMTGGKTGMARRLSWDEPSLTLTCSPTQKQTERCHPSETRPLTIREYARIQSFPDDWEFVGSMASQYRQIGNAVPVNLGYHVGKTVRFTLTDIESPRVLY